MIIFFKILEIIVDFTCKNQNDKNNIKKFRDEMLKLKVWQPKYQEITCQIVKNKTNKQTVTTYK